jgi:hypothetical protein
MGYDVFLFRKEVKEENSNLDFLENTDLVVPFTDEQFEKLKSRLLKYGYQMESQSPDEVIFNFKGGALGITVMLTKHHLSFSSGFDENGVFEISMTASEFTDSDEFIKFDPQAGGWQETL